MFVEELIVRSSIQIFLANPNHLKPEAFGSGCVVKYLDRFFLISVAHVTNYIDLNVYLETNLPSDKDNTPLQPVGGFCTFDAFKIDANMNIEEFEDLLNDPLVPIDITFAELIEPINLYQNEVDFGVFKVEAGGKAILFLDDIKDPTVEETYGFYGKIKHEYGDDDITLNMTPTLKHSLKFHKTNGYFHMFLAPEIIRDKSDYEGCSGAPVLDSEGSLIALACKIKVDSKIIYGFSIQECIKLLDIAIQTKML